jgi:hypothetical protein
MLFTNGGDSRPLVMPFPSLSGVEERKRFYRSVRRQGSAIVYFQDKLGGEISVSRSARSPEFAFDVTLAEVTRQDDGSLRVERFGILELQTMDFHGSYRHAVKNLRDALRLHGDGFPAAIRDNPDWAGERIEGPNIANVFKRTFYQILMKFQVATHPECAGVVFAIPQAVWDSWQRHLGKPSLTQIGERSFELRGERELDSSNSWIVVFDVDSSSRTTPNRIVITAEIRTDGDTLATQAFKRAPDLALEHGTTPQALLAAIRGRMVGLIPELG